MGRYARDPGGEDFENPEPGTYKARCFQVIDLGTHTLQTKDGAKNQNQVRVGFELVGTQMKDGRPFTVYRTYNNSLHENAALRKDLQSWRGAAFTDDELAGFDLSKLLGVPCRLNLVANDKYINVAAVMALDKGESADALQNPRVAFFLDEPDWEMFKQLSENTQKKIMESPEYKAAVNSEGQPDPASGENPAHGSDEDVPF